MKKYLLGMAAVVLAISLSAFTTPETKKSGRIYFPTDIFGNITSTTNGVEDPALLDCNEGPLSCAKGFDEQDNSVVEQDENDVWHLLNPSAMDVIEVTKTPE